MVIQWLNWTAFSPQNQKIFIYGKGFLTVMLSVDEWSPYLDFSPFHQSLKVLHCLVRFIHEFYRGLASHWGIYCNFGSGRLFHWTCPILPSVILERLACEAWYSIEPSTALHPQPWVAPLTRHCLALNLVASADNEATDMLTTRAAYSEFLKNQLAREHLRMKNIADKSRYLLEFPVGDKEYLKLQPYTESPVYIWGWQAATLYSIFSCQYVIS